MDLSQVQLASLALFLIVLLCWALAVQQAIAQLKGMLRLMHERLLKQQQQFEDLRKQVANVEWDLKQ